MGLDITWYRNLVKVDDAGDDPPDWYWRAFVNEGFPGRAGQIEQGAYYIGTERGHFRAGSYSGYNHWREQLAELARYSRRGIGDKPYSEGAWAATAGPFWELINFSDCEGVIGAEVSAKLAKDFAAFQARADTHPDEWFRDRYSVWRFAFEQAAHNGAVAFH